MMERLLNSQNFSDLIQVFPPNSRIEVFLDREEKPFGEFPVFVLYVFPRHDLEGRWDYPTGLSGRGVNDVKKKFLSVMGLKVVFRRKDSEYRPIKHFTGPSFTDPDTGRSVYKIQVHPTEGDSFIEVLTWEDCVCSK